MTRRTTLVLAGIILIQSVIAALAYTPAPHSGGDNAGYITLAHSLLDRGAYLELWDPGEPPHTKYPPVFPALLGLAMLLGAKSWATLKLVPAFSTVLAVAFTFLWARDRRGMAMGVVVALLLGLSESVVYYSEWILSDPTFLALTMAALWALEKALPGEDPRATTSGGGRGPWLALGMALVALAYLTRSAGLPLALATVIWLGRGKKWRAVAGFALAFGIPAGLWWLRGRVLGPSGYASEFWLVDPYQPHLGTIGAGELLGRVTGNLESYVTQIVPAGVAGDNLPAMAPLGVGLALVTLVGWGRVLREKAGVAELFFPVYFGLILLWPEAWSGDRFALPLLPLVFFYAGAALQWLLGPFQVGARRAVIGALVVAVAIPAALQTRRMAEGAGACRELTRMGRPSECLSPAMGEYLALAEWSGENLPDGAVVTTRKPRFFFLMSGVKAKAIPMVLDSDEFLARLREGGSRYVSLDFLDGMSGYYVYPAILDRLTSFCGMVEVGPPEEAGTQLLGIPDSSPGMAGEGTAEQTLARCPEEMFRVPPREGNPVRYWGIPLLTRGSPPGE